MSADVKIVLAGNPSCVKTAVFNALTGSRQRVGNWPGVTVDKKTGHFHHRDREVLVVDLPGTYSTSVISEQGAIDEKIACDYLSSGEANLIINVIDASNLERNLYLTLQLLELQMPMIVAVNMMDVLKQRGIALNLKRLSRLLGCPVVGLVAKQHQGIDELKDQIIQSVQKAKPTQFMLTLPEPVHQAIQSIANNIQAHQHHHNPHWLALRLLEGDRFAVNQVGVEINQFAKQQMQQIELTLNEETDIVIADARYIAASQLVQQ